MYHWIVSNQRLVSHTMVTTIKSSTVKTVDCMTCTELESRLSLQTPMPEVIVFANYCSYRHANVEKLVAQAVKVVLLCKKEELAYVRDLCGVLDAILSHEEFAEEYQTCLRHLINGNKFISEKIKSMQQLKFREEKLTLVERDILLEFSQDLDAKEIAYRRSISTKTVSTHKQSIQKKLELADDMQFISYLNFIGVRKHCQQCA